MRVLGIETSCDETAAAVFEARFSAGAVRPVSQHLRANVVASQTDLHARYGGVVPELASRHHLERLGPVIDEALDRASVGMGEVDAVAVTCGPGLVGALTVGVAAAKALAFASRRPLIGVNHLEGHIYANFLAHPDLPWPALALIVSGAHSDLVLMTGDGAYAILGRTRDDAAGEAFDKVARTLGLGYPGGPAIERLARRGQPGEVSLPRPFPDERSFDFSFSGLKTAVLRVLAGASRTGPGGADPRFEANVAAAFQDALVGVLVAKTIRAARTCEARSILLAGGVAANSALRERMAASASEAGLPLSVPPPSLCTDNAGMIAMAGAYRLARGERSSLRLGAYAELDLELPTPETGPDLSAGPLETTSSRKH